MDDNLIKWLDARFVAVESKIDAICANLEKAELRQTQCRIHCDSTSSSVFDRLSSLEKQEIAKAASETLRRDINDQFTRAEETRVQERQWFWIKVGSLFTGGMIVWSILVALIEKWIR